MAKISTLTDACATVDTAKWQHLNSGGGGSATIVGGAVRLTYDTIANAYSLYTSIDAAQTPAGHYDWTASSFIVEVTDPGPLQTGWRFSINFGPAIVGGGNYGRFDITSDNGLRAVIYNATVPAFTQSTGAGTWSATTHRWLRVRETGGTIFFDTSPDGTTWTNRFSTATTTATWSLASAQVMLAAERTATNASNGYSAFDNVNLPPAPAAPTGGGNFFAFFQPGFGSGGGSGTPSPPPAIQSSASWVATFDSQESFFYNYNLPLSQATDSQHYYDMAYGIDGYTSMFEATGNTAYLNKAITLTNNMITRAQVSSSLGASAFGDSYMGWISQREDVLNEEVPLFETYVWRYVTRMLRAISRNPATVVSHASQYSSILAFTEVNIFDKWYNRGRNAYMYRSVTNICSHWSYIALHLRQMTANSTRQTRCDEIRNAIDSTGMPNWSGDNFRSKMNGSLGGTLAGAYTWNPYWNNSPSYVQDVPHAGSEVGWIVESFDGGTGVWTQTDLDRFGKTLTDLCMPGHALSVNGTGAGSGWIADGWPKLGRFSVVVQQALEDYDVQGQGQYMAAMAENARRWGV